MKGSDSGGVEVLGFGAANVVLWGRSLKSALGFIWEAIRGIARRRRSETYCEKEDHENEEGKCYAKHFDSAC